MITNEKNFFRIQPVLTPLIFVVLFTIELYNFFQSYTPTVMDEFANEINKEWKGTELDWTKEKEWWAYNHSASSP